jgi:predicted metal-binding protein
MRSYVKYMIAALAAPAMFAASGALAQDAASMQKQIDQMKSVLPKFAIPMREVGDRFQNMYFAAKGGNWALAAYMSKYMNGAMNPATITKPNEYATWKSFYEQAFAPVNKAINAKDLKEFEAAYTSVITTCNGCHQSMGYGFIKVVKLSAPADNGIDYKVKSNPGDVPP